MSRCYQLIAINNDVVLLKQLNVSVFFLLFFGPKFGPIPLAKKYVFFPILKENSPQNEVFKKKKIIGKM